MAEKGKSKSKGSSHEPKPVKLHKTTDPARIRKILKSKGSVPVADQVDSNGELPIHAYIKNNDKKKFECLMAYLIHAECDLDHHNHEGMAALHLACDKDDDKSAKALIAFGANINSLTQNTERDSEHTPLDIIQEKRGLNSVIPEILTRIGGRRARDLEDDSDDDWSYELTTSDDCFTMKPVPSGGSVDPLELSDRLATMNGGRDETDHHDGYLDNEEQPDRLQFSSLPDQAAEKRKAFQTPDASIEMGLTLRSVMSASALRDASDSPFTSLEEDVGGSNLHATRWTPNSVSPLASSLENIAENQEEQEEEEEEENGGNEASNEAITNGRNESCSPDEHADVIPGGALVEDVPDSPKRLVNYAFAGGSLMEDFEKKTEAVLKRGVEDSIGDEGYAAWLQYREIERAKKMGSGFMEFDAPTPEKKVNPEPPPQPSSPPKLYVQPEPLQAKRVIPITPPNFSPIPRVKVQPEPLSQVDPSPPFQPSPPPKPKNTSRASGCRRKVMHRQRHLHDPMSSVTKSLSTRNKGMEVTKSIMGHSVRPREKMEPQVPHLMKATNEVQVFGELVKKSKTIGQKVLCLDGGGIKGLVQIEILSAIERMTGKRITELFDWIIGTSTGGIIALGLVYAGLRVDDLRRIYFEMKDSVFKSQSKILNTVCDTKALEELLIETLGTDKNMDSVHTPKVMITAVNKSTTKLPLVFFNNCFDDEYSSQPVWKVARYTSAAPVFFTECDNYVDGGVVANNPAMRGMVEIQDYFKKQRSLGHNYEISCMVSIGCGEYPPEELGDTNVTNLLKIRKIISGPGAAASALKHLLTLLTTALTQSEGDARMCEITCECQGIAYYRLCPEMFEDVGTAETDNIKLCDMIISAKEMLIQSSDHLKELIENLGCKPVAAKKPQRNNVV